MGAGGRGFKSRQPDLSPLGDDVKQNLVGLRRARCSRAPFYAGCVPSYRSILTVTVLRPGHVPQDVESAARNAVRRMAVLESFQIDVVRAEPRVTVRFTGSDDAEARDVHADVVDAVGRVARVERAWQAVVVGGRSVPLSPR